MAVNFFNPPRAKKSTPRNRPPGLLPLSAVEDVDIGPIWTSPHLLQRTNSRLLQEPEPYDELDVLGTGGNGKAILLRKRSNRSLLVVKIMNPFPGWSTTTITREAFLLKHRLPENDRIVRLTNYLHSAQVPQIQLYLEYCDGGDLKRLLNDYSAHGRTLPESFAWHAFRQIAEGLAFIHYGYDHKLGSNQALPLNTWKKVIHADLKPENILLRVSKISWDYPNLVLADFGNSHTEVGFHEAGTETWLPPEKHYVSEWGDTWTMGAIISSFAWRGAPPSREGTLSDDTYQRGLDAQGTTILIRHQFGIPETHLDQAGVPGTKQCELERVAVLVRPMLSYSHELNNLVASICHPHFHGRLGSWECLQIIWYEMEVGAARSNPFVPLMSDWKPPLPAGIVNEGESDTAPQGRRSADDDDPDHRKSSDDSSEGGDDHPDRGGTRKRKRIEENADKDTNNGRHAPDRESTSKRRHVEDGDRGNRDVLGSRKRGPIGKRRHLGEGSDEESHDRQDSPKRGSIMKRKYVEQGDDEEHHDGQDRPERRPTKRRRHTG